MVYIYVLMDDTLKFIRHFLISVSYGLLFSEMPGNDGGVYLPRFSSSDVRQFLDFVERFRETLSSAS